MFGRKLTAGLLAWAVPAGPALAQPFQGTAFLSPSVITQADASSLRGVEYTGRGERLIWDYRVFDWITVDAYLFEARYDDGVIEFQVNPEFGSEEAARAEVDTYAPALGRLPAVLLSRARSVHVNAGTPDHPNAARWRVSQVFGGNFHDRSFTIHTGRGEEYIAGGFLEEVLFHEGAHVSLQDHQDAPGWLEAQQADGAGSSPTTPATTRRPRTWRRAPRRTLRCGSGRTGSRRRTGTRSRPPSRIGSSTSTIKGSTGCPT